MIFTEGGVVVEGGDCAGFSGGCSDLFVGLAADGAVGEAWEVGGGGVRWVLGGGGVRVYDDDTG